MLIVTETDGSRWVELTDAMAEMNRLVHVLRTIRDGAATMILFPASGDAMNYEQIHALAAETIGAEKGVPAKVLVDRLFLNKVTKITTTMIGGAGLGPDAVAGDEMKEEK